MSTQVRDTLRDKSGGMLALGGKRMARGDGTTAASYSVPADGATARSTAGGPAPGQVIKNFVGVVTLAGTALTVNLEAVPVGRTRLITDFTATTTNASAQLLQIQAGGLNAMVGHVNSTKGLETPGIETQAPIPGGSTMTLVIPTLTGTLAFSINCIDQ